MAVTCDKYGFFNGLYGIEQSNWANYWKGIVPDGVLEGYGDHLLVYANSSGMRVLVKTGQAMVDNHRVWVTSEKALTIEAADSKPRYDLVVMRVVYGNNGESVAQLDVKKGEPSTTSSITNATAPSVTRETGTIYEIPLARVTVDAGISTIAMEKVADQRYLHRLIKNNSVKSFSTAAPAAQCICETDYEYRYSGSCNSLDICLPSEITMSLWMCSVCFTASNSFTGVAFHKYLDVDHVLGTVTISPKIAGDALTLTGRRYNLVIWYDGSSWWVASKAV